MNVDPFSFPLGPQMKMFLYYGAWVEFGNCTVKCSPRKTDRGSLHDSMF